MSHKARTACKPATASMYRQLVSYRYYELSSPAVVLRSQDGALHELTATGWKAAPQYSRHVAGASVRDVDKLRRRCRQRLNNTPFDEDASPSDGELLRRVRRWITPPLAYGAPRHFGDVNRQDDAEAAYGEELYGGLCDQMLEELVNEARDGYERQGKRVEGIERRAGQYQGGASISGGLVLTGTGLLAGKDAVFSGPMREVGLAALLIVSLCLLLSGWRAHQASVVTMSWARPNIRRKVLARAELENIDAVRIALLCALLLGQDRGQLIAKWKLARLKQATRYFVIGVSASIVASGFFVGAVIANA